MSRIRDAAVGSHERKRLVKGDGSGVDEQVLFCSDDLIRLIHDLLFSENVLSVRDGHKSLVHETVKGKSIFKGREQADYMNLFLSGQFHAGDHGDAIVFSMKNSGRAVGAGVVVCQCDHIQSFYGRHAD